MTRGTSKINYINVFVEAIGKQNETGGTVLDRTLEEKSILSLSAKILIVYLFVIYFRVVDTIMFIYVGRLPII